MESKKREGYFDTSKGYVYYENLGEYGNSLFWNAVRTNATNYYDKVTPVRAGQSATGQYLIKMGEIERLKERNLISSTFGLNGGYFPFENEKKFIQALNEATQLQMEFRNLPTVELVSSEEEMKEIIEVFSMRLNKQMNKLINIFPNQTNVVNALKNGDMYSFDMALSNLIETAIREAYKVTLNNKQKNLKNNKVLETLQTIQKIEQYRSAFQIPLFEAFGFNQFSKEMNSIFIKTARNGTNTEMYQNLKEGLNYTRTKQKSGTIDTERMVREVMGEIGSIVNGVRSNSIQWHSSIEKSQASKQTYKVEEKIIIDYDSFFIGERQDFHGINKRFVELKRAAEKTLVDIIYISKAIEFDVDTHYSLDGLKAVFQDVGYYNANSFINKLKQTAPGAIYSGGSERQELMSSLVTVIAHTLFDNYEFIGRTQNGYNGIGIVEANGSKIPLSTFLIAIGESLSKAEKNAEEMIRIDFHTPSTQYTYPQEEKTASASLSRWERQASISKAESYITINFLGELKKIFDKYS